MKVILEKSKNERINVLFAKKLFYLFENFHETKAYVKPNNEVKKEVFVSKLTIKKLDDKKRKLAIIEKCEIRTGKCLTEFS